MALGSAKKFSYEHFVEKAKPGLKVLRKRQKSKIGEIYDYRN
jgi:hypothetical protein